MNCKDGMDTIAAILLLVLLVKSALLICTLLWMIIIRNVRGTHARPEK